MTASRMSDVLAKIKTGEAASRADYRSELVAQRLTGIVENGYTSPDMQWGTEHEPFARASYEIATGRIVTEIDFIDHSTVPHSGASPDGLVGDDGMLEIKCPKLKTHIEYILAGVPPKKYVPQMMWQMACANRKWVDFVSYHPNMPEEMRLFIVRYERDDEAIDQAEAEVIKFLSEVEETLGKLKSKFNIKES